MAQQINIVATAYNIVMVFAGLGVAVLAFGILQLGFVWMLSVDDPASEGRARRGFQYLVGGFIIVLSAVTIAVLMNNAVVPAGAPGFTPGN